MCIAISPQQQGLALQKTCEDQHKAAHISSEISLNLIQMIPRWWFQIFFILTPTWGNDPI